MNFFGFRLSENMFHIRVASRENRLFAYAKTKAQISFAVTAKLISAFVFATQIVQSLFFLNPKFKASSHRLWLYIPVYIGNPGDRFSHNEAQLLKCVSRGQFHQ